MRWNPLSRIKNALGVAVDWRVRDVLEAEREATMELGRIFVDTTADLCDRLVEIERRLADLEDRLGGGATRP